MSKHLKPETVDTRCNLCEALFQGSRGHCCPYHGVELVNLLKEMRRSILSLEAEVAGLRQGAAPEKKP